MLDAGHYPTRGSRGAKRKFPWDELALDEHFIVPKRTLSSFTGTLQYADRSRAPKRFRSRMIGENLKVWRVK